MGNSARRSVNPCTRDNTSVRHILFFVTYLFMGSLLALSAASSAWAAMIA